MADAAIGTAALLAKFSTLKNSMQSRIARMMVVVAGKLVREEAKQIARGKGLKKTGAMIKNIAVKRDRAVPQDTVQYNVGVRHGRELTKTQKTKGALKINAQGRVVLRDDPWYYFLIEHTGAKRHSTAPGADRSSNKKQNVKPIHPGFAKKPFLQPALESKRQEAIDAMAKTLEQEIGKLP